MSANLKKRILVVDDEAQIRQFLKGYLSENGFHVEVAPDSAAMARILEKHHVDLVILDLMLGHEDGLDVARRIRERSNIPIVMLTGKGEDIDRIIGLEVGADDYLGKPFNARELLARIKSVLRRATAAPIGAIEGNKLERRAHFGGWILDLHERTLVGTDGRQSKLSPRLFDVMTAFVTNPGRTLTRVKILEIIGRDDKDVFDRSIDIQINRLRKSIEKDPKNPEMIQTVYGEGYKFEAVVEWK